MKFQLFHLGVCLQELSLEDGKEYLLGRSKDCDIVLEEPSKNISRKHIKIYQSSESGLWIIQEISELTALHFDGQAIESLEISESANLHFCNYIFKFFEKEPVQAGSLVPTQDEDSNIEKQNSNLPTDKNLQEDVSLDEKTTLYNSQNLIYFLYISIAGEFSNHRVLDSDRSWFIGRSKECDISIDYGILTRKHLKVTRQKDKFFITDLGSANKTLLNGKELVAQKATPLIANDKISISDLQIVFEVKNQDFDEMMAKLPELPNTNDDQKKGFLGQAAPKVILEDVVPEDDEKDGKSGLTNKKFLIILTIFILIGLGFYQFYTSKNEQTIDNSQKQKLQDQKQKFEIFYQNALTNFHQQKFRICIEHLKELHTFVGKNDVKESQLLLQKCEAGKAIQEEIEERDKKEKKRKETEAKVKKLANKCQDDYKKQIIKTVDDLNFCSKLVLALDPTNIQIANIKNQIIETNQLRALKQQKIQQRKDLINSKMALYKRAQRIAKKGEILKTVAAYKRFIKSVKYISFLQKVSKKAQTEMQLIQKQYDDNLNSLYASCKSLIQKKEFQKAYVYCEKILDFKEEDQVTKDYLKNIKKTLNKKLKPLYTQSIHYESSSQITKAKDLWKDIIKQDIKQGYYYKKARHQLDKYK